MTKFPLEHAPFPPLNLIDSDKEAILSLSDILVNDATEDYERHLYEKNGIVDAMQWVRVKQFEDVVVYQDRQALKERRQSRVDRSRDRNDKNRQMLKLLWSGTVLGSLDDIMYAAVNRTAEEAKVKAAFVESNVIDFAVLDTLVHPTVDEPFRGMQIKWAVNAGPPMMRSVVRCRDFVYMESTGMTALSTGERVGFQLLHTLSLPGAPLLHEHKLVRGNITVFHVFHQKTENVVETYVKAFLDLMGDMPLRVATTLSTTGVVSVWKLSELALMKKLNWKLSQRRAIVPTDRRDSCYVCGKKFIRGGMARRRSCKICVKQCCAHCCVPMKMFYMPSYGRTVVERAANVCKGCLRAASYTNSVDVAQAELSKTSARHKEYIYWSAPSPTSSSSSVML